MGTTSEPGTRTGQMVSLLRTRNPFVHVDLSARTSAGACQGLTSGELDVGVLISFAAEVGLTYYELTTVPYRVAGPAAWRSQVAAADWAELARLPWLIPGGSSACNAMLAELFEHRGLALNSVLRFDNSSVGRAALEAGAGLMLVREDYAAQAEADGKVVMSPIARTEIALAIAHQSRRKNDPLIQAFVEVVKVIWTEMKLLTARRPAAQAEPLSG